MTTWFITGCSTGIGKELAKAVFANGSNAVVTARNPAAVQDIVAGHPSTALPLPLDETNFFGLVALTEAVLPGMRTRRRGHIINISSTAGRMAQPGSGFYSATKFAVGGLSDALRKELKPLGIHVTVVEPSGFRTDFAGRSLQQSKRTIDDYDATAGARRKERINSHGQQPGDPVRAAAALIQITQSASPPFRLALGRAAVTRIRAELEGHIKEIDTRAELSNGADFPT